MWWDLIFSLVRRNFMKMLATSAIASFAGDGGGESIESLGGCGDFAGGI